jgi:hypothetical protein
LSGMHDQPRQITSDNDDSSEKSDSNRGHAKKRIYPLISINYRRSIVKRWDTSISLPKSYTAAVIESH